jgi:hypothetical protein
MQVRTYPLYLGSAWGIHMPNKDLEYGRFFTHVAVAVQYAIFAKLVNDGFAPNNCRYYVLQILKLKVQFEEFPCIGLIQIHVCL